MRNTILLAALFVVAGCSSDSATAPDRPITAVTVTPSSSALVLGGSVQLAASVTGGYTKPTIAWSSSNSSVAQVSDSGKVTTKGIGTATITATPSAGTLVGTAAITVTAGSVDRVAVCDRGVTASCNDHATLGGIGSSVAVRATSYNALGGDITSTCTYSWTPNVANVVSITFTGDATKRDAVITRTGYGIISVIVNCSGIPAVFTVEGPLSAP